MNFLRKGPEIKFSDLKVPQVVSDLYWDLRDRYLLPAVVLLLIAIVAVPMAMGESSGPSLQESVEDGSVAADIAGMSAVPAATGELVAKATPGLRDYRRRLHDLQKRDPFVQQFSGGGGVPAATEEGGSGGSTTSPESSTAAPETSSPSSTPETPGTEHSPSSPASPNSSDITWFSYAMDVRIVSLGEAGNASKSGANESNTAVRHSLPELTVLPSHDAPAAIYMGVTKDGKKALLMISDQVQGIFGDATCVLGATRCQLLAVEPGLPVTFVYGPAERTFRIEILKLRLLDTDHLNRAPLGSGKNKKKRQQKNETFSQSISKLSPRP
jgi:hypothetical protein